MCSSSLSVFINRATWNELSMLNMKAEKMKCLLHWNHKHSNNICEQLHSYNEYYNYIKAFA